MGKLWVEVSWSLTTVAVFFVTAFAQGQSLNHTSGLNRSSGTEYSGKMYDLMSGGSDPAALVRRKGLSAGVASERRFMLSELSTYAAAISYGTEGGGMGLNIQHSGSPGFTETNLGLGYGRDLGLASLGVRFNLHRISATGYGSVSAFSADISFILKLSEQLRAGIHAINPVPVSFGKTKDLRFPSILELGFGYDISDDCFVFVEVQKETDRNTRFHIGIHYCIAKRLYLRMDVKTDLGGPGFAAGWQLQGVRIAIQTSYHPDLGISPGLQVLFQKPAEK